MEEVSMEVDITNGGSEGQIEKVNTPAEDSILETVNTAEDIFQYPALFTGSTLLELCNSSWTRYEKAQGDIQPYLRGCKWSPDGTCCLSVVNNDGMHLSELPRDLYSGIPPSDRTIDILDSVVHVKESGLIYDFCWYPGMNSAIPESCW